MNTLHLSTDEKQAFTNDLCADLHERMLRAVMDLDRPFWEENFLHSLFFERKHVYQAFMTREGHWYNQRSRVPHRMISSLERLLVSAENDGGYAGDIEDTRAQEGLLAVERSEVLQMVLALPEKLKAVVLLLFWEQRTEKEIAQLLKISDRMVRYRLQNALKLLRVQLVREGE